ncbi:MalY/PatB family protein [Terrisporobacter mayombei]|uniref:cysteine-S-conjugate beta-lyase n=1 Tax=Terrisporobacter mayombei TaxID=1541 RepID=A0ABY9Q757_9FIRM|nr:MalY/PatB family protein [Terrisporobacter mayombei]MCC3868800.1 pyridoxal phosphate-dependent aminotransferase [Terrisporobacter mayombei]WMT83070.1 Protein MalY [Terrisporobacter mayombei]
MIDFNKEVDRLGTYCTQWDYVEDRFGKKNLLPFTISDMDLEYPDEVAQVLQQRLDHRVLGYSRWKHDDFRNSIKNWYSKRFNCNIDSEWIYYSPSVMYSISKLIEIFSKDGDGVLLNTPAYNAFYDVLRTNNRKVIKSPLKNENGHYSIDFEDFKEKCKESKLFILCNPHNPTGRVWTEEELIKMINICKEYDVKIISDDIHMDIVYGSRMTPILKVAEDYLDSIYICTSPSKSFNIPALTGSYVIIPEAKTRDRFENIVRYRDFVNSPAILSVLATMTCYNDCEYWIEELLNHLENNLKYTISYLEEYLPQLKLKMPQGCYFAWIDFSELNIPGEQFQKMLIDIGEVAIMNGHVYGEECEFYLRLNVACSRDKLIDGLDRLKKTIDYIKL